MDGGIYDDVIREFKNRIDSKAKAYGDWRRGRQQELMDLAREQDLMQDRRHNRKARMRNNGSF